MLLRDRTGSRRRSGPHGPRSAWPRATAASGVAQAVRRRPGSPQHQRLPRSLGRGADGRHGVRMVGIAIRPGQRQPGCQPLRRRFAHHRRGDRRAPSFRRRPGPRPRPASWRGETPTAPAVCQGGDVDALVGLGVGPELQGVGRRRSPPWPRCCGPAPRCRRPGRGCSATGEPGGRSDGRGGSRLAWTYSENSNSCARCAFRNLPPDRPASSPPRTSARRVARSTSALR